ncbi:MAG: transglycosylase domain-containing protein [Deltaproteobacteria bacterium]|nr:transglycosylase domain-containing protein [Deltaproteobacteria bacterium]
MRIRWVLGSSSPPRVDGVQALPNARLAAAAQVTAHVLRWFIAASELLLGTVVGAALVYELDTSALQARVFSDYAARVTFRVSPGASHSIAFPHSGPFDHYRGYSALPIFQNLLERQGFRVVAQARASNELRQLLAWNVAPPYDEPPAAGLVIRGPDGATLFNAVHENETFQSFEDIPALIVDALLFIENRELLTPLDPRTNPAIEWDRLAHAGLLFIGTKLGVPVDLQGGSTLAVQLEKYRHSPGGRTSSGFDKLRQLLAASLRSYQDGEDTSRQRRQIIVDYLNTIPLAAAPGYGEVYGLGAGLRAWFGVDLRDIVSALRTEATDPSKVRAFKQVLTLIAAVRAPTDYLSHSPVALEQRVTGYTDLLAQAGKIDSSFARALQQTQIEFLPYVPLTAAQPFIERKGLSAVRTHLLRTLRMNSLYDMDRLDLTVDSTVDMALQQEITQLFLDLADPRCVSADDLKGEHLLRTGDPSKVIYSLVLFERTQAGNLARVHTDNLDRPFDINDGIKMELGSTAKLRTLAHYLEIVAQLHHEWSGRPAADLTEPAKLAHDPITKWAIETIQSQPQIELSSLLAQSLERKYSANPGESFFTGSGVHTFGNFDRNDNGRILTLREALRKSTNLVFVRLMRDLVRFHQARLPYEAGTILDDPDNPVRQTMLAEIADNEAHRFLWHTYRRYADLKPERIADRMLGGRVTSPRHLAILFFAWKIGTSEEELGRWLRLKTVALSPQEVHRLYKAYSNPRLTIADYGYLLGRNSLEVWTTGQLVRQSNLTWDQLYARSTEARRTASAWLFKTRNRHAQDTRLRIRVEQDAFARMTPYWQHLGFPFEHLIPSLATALGNSSDRPIALADLMGIIVNDGMRLPLQRIHRLHFASRTPYETVMVPTHDTGQRVMEPEVAQTLRSAISEVVDAGTARRVKGAFQSHGKTLIVGGKTGSGDNRFETFSRSGGVISSRAVSRTATFVFYIGDRYFGVITAHVPGKDAAQYEFTSALPLSVLKLAAPAINAKM